MAEHPKHEIVLRGGPRDGTITKVFVYSRGLIVPKLAGYNDAEGFPVFEQIIYRPTDEREDGRQVFRLMPK